MTEHHVIGCDPGMTGAIATLTASGDLVDVVDMPVFAISKRVKGKDRTKRHVNVHELGRIFSGAGAGARAVIEHVGPMPTDSRMSAFQFGFGAGALHGAAGALKMQIETVTPQTWKKHFGLTADKDQARQLATRRWPAHAHLFKRKLDAGRAEAALIALYSIETARAGSAARAEA